MSAPFFIVEDFDPSINYHEGTVVSLTPTASYQLEKNNIPYQIPEDFYSEKDLRLKEESYFFEQLKWFHQLDETLMKGILLAQEHHILLARSYYRRIKYLMDTLVIQSAFVHGLLKQAQYGKIIYVKKKMDKSLPKEFALFGRTDNEISFLDLFQIHSPLYSSISFSVSWTTSNSSREMKFRNDSVLKKYGMRGILKAKTLIIRIGHFIVDCFRRLGHVDNQRVRNKNIFFLSSGDPHQDIPLEALRREGACIFNLSKGDIYSFWGILRRHVFHFDKVHSKTSGSLWRECAEVSRQIQDQDHLFDFINQHCQGDVKKIFAPYLLHFVRETCPQMLSQAIQMRNFYEREKINCIVAREGNEIWNATALIACQMLPNKVVSVGIQHGIKIYDDKVWEMTDLDPFDYYLASDSFSEEKYQGILNNNTYIRSCQVVQSPHFLTSIRNQSKKNSSPCGWKKTDFVPTSKRCSTTEKF